MTTMNPELRRNLWLELTPQRLVAMPLVLWLVFLAAYVSSGEEIGSAVATVALLLYTGIPVVWGMRLASASVLEEVRGGTWDTQKLSALGPWTMTWGKLFGATAFAWYGGLICLGAYLLALHELGDDISLRAIALMLGTALLVQAVSLTAGLVTVRRNPRARGSGGALVLFIGFALVVNPILKAAESWTGIAWYGREYALLDFLAASITTFALWAVVAAWRVMCQELAVRTLPWVWLAFHGFATAYVAGLALPSLDRATTVALALLNSAFAVSAVLVYLAVFLEPKDPIVARRWWQRLRAGDWRRLAEDTPCWLVSIGLVLALAPIIATTRAGTLAYGVAMQGLGAAAVPAALYALRDVALLHYFAYAPGARRPEVNALVALVLLYWLVPALLGFLELDPVAALVRPPVHGQPLFATCVLAVQAGVAGWFAVNRWHRRMRILGAAGD
ncbi:MAG: hypothetical protein IT495_16120 [Gammaproteobacteria bacterium]|nr:hypothetical protein [Gammaproteobacteria bacterium]